MATVHRLHGVITGVPPRGGAHATSVSSAPPGACNAAVGGTDMIPGRLVERDGERAGKVHVLPPAVTSIGRGAENDIVLAVERVSRRHAQVTWDGTRYRLADLGSRNGTFVNGHRIAESRILQHGDVLSLAGVELTFDAAGKTVTWRPEGTPAAVLRIDTETAEVWARGSRVHVSANEYRALALLYRRGGALVTKEELAAQVWPEYQGDVSDYNIEQLLFRLRRKIEADPGHPRALVTVRGLGYRLVVT
jgi:DNA-binding response OmpR family regulator